MSEETIFADGMSVKKPQENAPDFVKLNMSFKADSFIKFLEANQVNGWVNVDLLKSKGGKLYCKLNTYKKVEKVEEKVDTIQYPETDINPDDIPL